MNKNYKKHLADNFQYALFHLQLRKSYMYAYYNDYFFNDLVKMRVKNGIILTVSTYEFTKPIEECLSERIWWTLKNDFMYNRRFSYKEIRELLINEGSVRETKPFDIKLKDMDLVFSYYRSSKNSFYLHEENRVDNVKLNDVSDNELRDIRPSETHNSTFNAGIEHSYKWKMYDAFSDYDRPNLLFHLIDDVVKLARERYDKEMEELKKHASPSHTYSPTYRGHIVRDEWGNELSC